jgi:hypothetical protein
MKTFVKPYGHSASTPGMGEGVGWRGIRVEAKT